MRTLSSHSLIPASMQSLAQSFSAPEGKLFLMYGDPVVFKLSLLIGARALQHTGAVAIVDGCNGFDIRALVRFAQQRKLNPDALLDRVFISRGFTCYQMEAAITDRLPAFLVNRRSTAALIFGLLDTFYDEQAPLREVQQMLPRILSTFDRIKSQGVSLLLSSHEWHVHPPERNNLFRKLKTGMDRVYYLADDKDQKTQLFLERSNGVV